MRMSSSISLLTFALAGVEASQHQPYLLYSDAFIAENAFQPENNNTNEIPFDLRRTQMTPMINEHMPLHVAPVDHQTHIDEAHLKGLKHSMDLDGTHTIPAHDSIFADHEGVMAHDMPYDHLQSLEQTDNQYTSYAQQTPAQKSYYAKYYSTPAAKKAAPAPAPTAAAKSSPTYTAAQRDAYNKYYSQYYAKQRQPKAAPAAPKKTTSSYYSTYAQKPKAATPQPAVSPRKDKAYADYYAKYYSKPAAKAAATTPAATKTSTSTAYADYYKKYYAQQQKAKPATTAATSSYYQSARQQPTAYSYQRLSQEEEEVQNEPMKVEKETGPGVPLDRKETKPLHQEKVVQHHELMYPEHDIREAMPMGVPLEPEHIAQRHPVVAQAHFQPEHEQMLAPEHFEPEHFAPEYFTPERFAPEHFAPEQFAPEHFAPERFASEHFAPQHFAPEHFAPEHFAPEQFAPEHFAPEHFAPEHFAPEHFAPEYFAPEHFAPEHFAPEHMSREYYPMYDPVMDHERYPEHHASVHEPVHQQTHDSYPRHHAQVMHESVHMAPEHHSIHDPIVMPPHGIPLSQTQPHHPPQQQMHEKPHPVVTKPAKASSGGKRLSLAQESKSQPQAPTSTPSSDVEQVKTTLQQALVDTKIIGESGKIDDQIESLIAQLRTIQKQSSPQMKPKAKESKKLKQKMVTKEEDQCSISDEKLVKQAEGWHSCKYYDTRGVPSICYGQSLTSNHVHSLIDEQGANYAAVMAGVQCLTERQCDALLHHDLEKARETMHDLYHDSSVETCPCAQNALIDMSYNLGEKTLFEFESFNSLMRQGKWHAAADDLAYGSSWCDQVSKRCYRNLKLIKSCVITQDKKVDKSQLAKKQNKYCESDMKNLWAMAREGSLGFAPDARSYSHVADFIDATGYGGIKKGSFNEAIPENFWYEALDFSSYLNYENHAEKLHLKNIASEIGNNPFNAPVGAIIVVHGVPGTAHIQEDDISVRGEGGSFYNGGMMSYGGSFDFPTDTVRGIYVPTKCSTATQNMLPFFVDHLTTERNTAENSLENLAQNQQRRYDTTKMYRQQHQQQRVIQQPTYAAQHQAYAQTYAYPQTHAVTEPHPSHQQTRQRTPAYYTTHQPAASTYRAQPVPTQPAHHAYLAPVPQKPTLSMPHLVERTEPPKFQMEELASKFSHSSEDARMHAQARPDPKVEQRQSLMDMVTTASLAIESMRDEEIKRTGLDPTALSMLPELVLYNQ